MIDSIKSTILLPFSTLCHKKCHDHVTLIL